MIELLQLDKLYYGNTIAQWAFAMVGVFASFLLARTIFWVLKTVIEPLTRKTETDLDDIIIENVQAPVSLGIALIGARLSIESLHLGQTGHAAVEGIFHVFFAVNAAWLLARLYDALHVRYIVPLAERTETDLDDQLLPIVRSGMRAIIWFLGGVIGLNNAGYDVMAVLAGFGIGGVAFALAAQDTVANVFGGLTVMTTRPFRMGDFIVVGSHTGFINTVGLRSSVLVTFGGEKITIPNKMFTDTVVVNHDARPHYRTRQQFYLSHLTEADQVTRALELCREVCVELDFVKDDCFVSFADVNDYGLLIDFVFDIKLHREGDGFSDWYDKMTTGKSRCLLRLLQRLEAEEIQLGLEMKAKLDLSHLQGRGAFGL